MHGEWWTIMAYGVGDGDGAAADDDVVYSSYDCGDEWRNDGFEW